MSGFPIVPGVSSDPVDVIGTIASGVADDGTGPVKVGGVVNTGAPAAASTGQRKDLWMSRAGAAILAGVAGNGGDGQTAVSFAQNSGESALPLMAGLFNGATWDRPRTPNIVKTVQATASGNTALWTPAGGKKFRLMRLLFDLTSNVSRAAGAVTTFSLQDSTSDISVTFDVFIPTTAVTTGFQGYTSGWIDLGNGVLSAAANNVLNVNLGAALATGVCRVTCCGTEE